MQRILPGSSRDRLLGRRAPAPAGDAKLRDLGARPLPLQAPMLEPVRPVHEAQLIIKDLMARAPEGVSANFLKFENATAEELAEMIRALRHLLGEDET